MMKIAFAAVAALMMMPAFGGPSPARADDAVRAGQAVRMAQVDIDVGRGRDYDRDRNYDRDRSERRRDRDLTVGVGPGGVRVGPRHCRTVTTWIDRDDGRRVKRTERRCD